MLRRSGGIDEVVGPDGSRFALRLHAPEGRRARRTQVGLALALPVHEPWRIHRNTPLRSGIAVRDDDPEGLRSLAAGTGHDEQRVGPDALLLREAVVDQHGAVDAPGDWPGG